MRAKKFFGYNNRPRAFILSGSRRGAGEEYTEIYLFTKTVRIEIYLQTLKSLHEV